MEYEEALSYIHSFKRTKAHPSLERIKKLLSLMGDPQNTFRAVHVAGTNGKGSFCAMLDTVLRESGYITGLYTSPYIERFNERMCFCGEPVSDGELAEITLYVKRFADTMEDSPTEFDITTAVGFEFFRRKKVDIAVVEAGLGGRFDSTNVFENPLLSVITGVALDHTELLGDTVEKIAFEKAGIIKRATPVLYGGNDISAGRVIEKVAAECGSHLTVTDISDVKIKNADLDGTVFDFGLTDNIHISLLGMCQPYNAANVVNAVRILRKRGVDIPDRALLSGLEKTRWKARFERLCLSPDVFFDGSHNPQGIDFAVKTIKYYFGEKKVNLVMGVMRDKDYTDMARELAPIAEHVYTLTPDNPRALPSAELAKIFALCGARVTAFDRIKDGVMKALADASSKGCAVVALGSLYLYSDFKKALEAAV